MDQKQKELLESAFGTPLTHEDHARRKREALRLKEQLSSIPWHAERGQKGGMAYWYQLLDSCAARGLPDDELSDIGPYLISNSLDGITKKEPKVPDSQLKKDGSSEEIKPVEESDIPPLNPEEALCLLKARPIKPTWYEKIRSKFVIF